MRDRVSELIDQVRIPRLNTKLRKIWAILRYLPRELTYTALVVLGRRTERRQAVLDRSRRARSAQSRAIIDALVDKGVRDNNHQSDQSPECDEFAPACLTAPELCTMPRHDVSIE
jgi:hypothetical protein